MIMQFIPWLIILTVLILSIFKIEPWSPSWWIKRLGYVKPLPPDLWNVFRKDQAIITPVDGIQFNTPEGVQVKYTINKIDYSVCIPLNYPTLLIDDRPCVFVEGNSACPIGYPCEHDPGGEFVTRIIESRVMNQVSESLHEPVKEFPRWIIYVAIGLAVALVIAFFVLPQFGINIGGTPETPTIPSPPSPTPPSIQP